MAREIIKAIVGLLLIPLVTYGAYVGYAYSNGNLKTSEDYPKTMIVGYLSPDEDMVTLIDPNGNVWQFYGIEDYAVGDAVSLIMNDNGTADIHDDIIVDVRYSGYKGK